MKKAFLFLFALTFAISASAHPGRTDESGGHNDIYNESGLGFYHFHHGYPAHLHENGICPYEIETSTHPELTQLNTPKEEQTQTPEQAYSDGYWYALFYENDRLYDDGEFSKVLNLGIAIQLFLENSSITYADPKPTTDQAFEEGKIQANADLNNQLAAYDNMEFYTDNIIYQAGYDAALEENQLKNQNAISEDIFDADRPPEEENELNASTGIFIFILFFTIIITHFATKYPLIKEINRISYERKNILRQYNELKEQQYK